jgi:hypothetical protein
VKLVRYNYKFKNLVNFAIGVACGRGLLAMGLSTAVHWTLVVVVTVFLYVVLNYRLVSRDQLSSTGDPQDDP